MFHRYLSNKIGTYILSLLLIGLIAINAIVFASDNSLENYAATYHLEINEIVNQHVYAMISFFNTKTDLDSLSEEDINLLVAPAENALEEECYRKTEDDLMNITSTCLNYKMRARYNEYSDLLDSQADGFNVDVDEVTNQKELIGASGSQQSFIFAQKQEASDLIEQTVKFYNQLYFSYPIHKQYEQTIDQLTELKSNLKKLRRKLKRYPSKFHNATSTSCT